MVFLRHPRVTIPTSLVIHLATMPPKKAPKRKEPDDVNAKDLGQDRKRTAVASVQDAKRKRGNKSDQKAKEPARRSQRQQTADKKTQKDGYGSAHHSTERLPKPASPSRLPEKGHKVQWKAMPGICHGEVIEVLQSEKSIEGKTVKASKDDPRIVIRSTGPSRKIAVHKTDKVYF